MEDILCELCGSSMFRSSTALSPGNADLVPLIGAGGRNSDSVKVVLAIVELLETTDLGLEGRGQCSGSGRGCGIEYVGCP